MVSSKSMRLVLFLLMRLPLCQAAFACNWDRGRKGAVCLSRKGEGGEGQVCVF